jgi:hypothetical protein
VSSSEARPLAGELKRVRDLYAPFGPEPLTDRYVLLTIDGPPSCPYEDPRRMCESAMQEMTRLAGAMAAVKTFVVALGDDAAGDPCLEELALMGGAASERPDPLFVARNRDDLQRAFDNVFDEVASSVCELNLAPGSFDPSRSSIAIYIRDEEIPRDRMRQNGWDFVDRSNLRIQLYGNACESLKSTEPRDVFVWSCRG